MSRILYEVPPAAPELDARLRRLEGRIATVETALTALRERVEPPPTPEPEAYDLRRRAVDRLRRKRGLSAHLVAYVAVNLLLGGIWFATTPGGFYWPVIPLLGWGIGVAFNVWDVYPPQPDEKRIEREMRRMAR